LLQLHSRLSLVGMIRSSAAGRTETLPGIEIPQDLRVFHQSLP
jgi:hypothetical protein